MSTSKCGEKLWGFSSEEWFVKSSIGGLCVVFITIYFKTICEYI